MTPARPAALPLLLSLYLPSLLLSICNGLLVPTLPVFASGLEIPYFQIGLILAGDSLGMLLTDLPAGLLLRRIGRKQAMLLGLLISGLSVLALAFTTETSALILLRMLAGAGAALFNISRHVYITEEIPVVARGRTNALFGGTGRLGSFIGPAVGGLVAASFGFSSTFGLYALLAGVTFLLCLLFVREDEPRRAAAGKPDAAAPAVGPSLQLIVAASAGQLLAQLIRTGRRVIIPLFAANVLGMEVDTVGFIVGAAAALDFAFFWPAGIIMDRYGRKHAIVPSFLIQALSLALLPLTTGFSSLLLVAGLGGLGNGISSGTMMTLGSDLAPAGNSGRFLGFWRLVGDTGAASGPLLTGLIAQASGLGPTSWVIALLGAAGALLFAYRMPETLKRP